VEVKVKLLLSNILFFLLCNSIIGHVLLNYPEGNEVFIAGEEITIEWEVLVYHGPGSFELFYSDNGGLEWKKIVDGIDNSILAYNWIIPNIETTNAKIKVIQVNTDTIYEHYTKDFTISLATDIGKFESIPYSFKLNNPYPNPFNNRSVISYELSNRGNVQLLIYDMLGRKIETLIDEIHAEGEYNFNWNASSLSSGTYIVFLKSKTSIASKKIILMK